ncbi:MAG: hypothetical protein CO148_09135 [Nitrospirae bacterium CG_4_9_14_3_um_filter_41_27]|nr:MAG: hypothetical protein COV68_01355 [Nitrospirae bacterium CG11_big_fil_rev_8_21_14_0_20_41_14]PIV42736.1 MAG: hypothetical protein COS27_06465 [Nitrospirae bacterium CG02_land_8_20_14_3_00_41_53]PIW87954.1 MAG: hypothetical protein COZ94_02335 [Nitrospirae bacterium CG_4_8_14_3_um_filter_41_47]PJA79094.1 MAG: hypothetical protein CO148_09135 [Nitrospirae bacterium CG_4_9_14_3_um_filter_41_27]
MKKVILLLLGILILHACGYQEGIVQKEGKSFIKFAGNLENVSVQIDDMNQFVLKSGSKSGADDNKLYQVSQGKHSIKVYRDGNLIVNRILFLDNQATAEVIIP